MSTFWIVFYWIFVPVALVAGLVALVQNVKLRWGSPVLNDPILFFSESVRAQSPSMRGAPPFRLWVTDQELILRLRPGYRAAAYAAVETRIGVDAVASVVQLLDGKVRLGLKGEEGRHWDFAMDHPGPLLEALKALSRPLG